MKLLILVALFATLACVNSFLFYPAPYPYYYGEPHSVVLRIGREAPALAETVGRKIDTPLVKEETHHIVARAANPQWGGSGSNAQASANSGSFGGFGGSGSHASANANSGSYGYGR